MSDIVKSMPNLDEQIRDRVHEVVRGTLSVDDFELWFVGEAWEAEGGGLVADVTHLMTDKDLFDRDELVERLWAVAATVRTGEPVYATGAAAVTIAMEPMTTGNRTISRHWAPAGI